MRGAGGVGDLASDLEIMLEGFTNWWELELRRGWSGALGRRFRDV